MKIIWVDNHYSVTAFETVNWDAYIQLKILKLLIRAENPSLGVFAEKSAYPRTSLFNEAFCRMIEKCVNEKDNPTNF